MCISRFKDCPLCGADIEKLEADTNLQSMVDRFIEGHARIKRAHVDTNGEGEQVSNDDKKVIYEDVSLDRGAFLVQQAMRVSPCSLLYFLIYSNKSSFSAYVKLVSACFV